MKALVALGCFKYFHAVREVDSSCPVRRVAVGFGPRYVLRMVSVRALVFGGGERLGGGVGGGGIPSLLLGVPSLL
jgi:hypothetical protein